MDDIKNESAKILADATTGLIKVIENTSYEMWQRKDFRLYLDFDKLSQTEQDRIFNELQVSVLGLFYLHLEYVVINSIDSQRKVIKALNNDIVPAFLNLYIDLEVEKVFVDQWEKLINIRLTEYKKDYKMALKESLNMNEFRNKEELRIVWARIETITIDCLTHIRHEKVEEKDPLWKLLRKWFQTLDTMLNSFTNPQND